MRLYCDNKSAINIAYNLVQHDRTKHIEVDRHVIKEKLDSGLICTPYVTSGNQLADVLTKGLSTLIFENIISKLRMENIYSPASREVRKQDLWLYKNHYLLEICWLVFRDKTTRLDNHIFCMVSRAAIYYRDLPLLYWYTTINLFLKWAECL